MISESYKFTVIRADKLDLDVRLRKYPKYLQRDLLNGWGIFLRIKI